MDIKQLFKQIEALLASKGRETEELFALNNTIGATRLDALMNNSYNPAAFAENGVLDPLAFMRQKDAVVDTLGTAEDEVKARLRLEQIYGSGQGYLDTLKG